MLHACRGGLADRQREPHVIVFSHEVVVQLNEVPHCVGGAIFSQ